MKRKTFAKYFSLIVIITFPFEQIECVYNIYENFDDLNGSRSFISYFPNIKFISDDTLFLKENTSHKIPFFIDSYGYDIEEIFNENEENFKKPFIEYQTPKYTETPINKTFMLKFKNGFGEWRTLEKKVVIVLRM